MNNKITIIALFGKSGAGKDTIQNKIVSLYPNIFHNIISCTTRPKRDYEEEGKDYYFLTKEKFTQTLLNGAMLEATNFREWFYGTPIWALDENKVNIGVFNIAGIEALMADSRINLLPVYIKASDKTRLIRNLNREKDPDCQEICRRFQTDEKDFSDIPFRHLEFDNNSPDLKESDLRAFVDNLL